MNSVYRAGTFFILLGIGLGVLFVFSDMARQANFWYLILGGLSVIAGFFMRGLRPVPPPPPSGRFRILKKSKERDMAGKPSPAPAPKNPGMKSNPNSAAAQKPANPPGKPSHKK